MPFPSARFCSTTISFTVLFAAISSPVICLAQFAEIRRDVKIKFEIDQFRFFYNTAGKHQVEPEDANGNGIPDQVEDVARQTWVAHKIFVDALGFEDPLHSERYKAAKFIDVIFLSRQTIGRSATAYDGLQHFKRQDDPEDLRTLCFDIASDIDPIKSSTPTHEYFHLIQNGMTFFKTRWFTEGMARWSEHATGQGAIGKRLYKGTWPQSEDIRQELFNLQNPYSAEFGFWNPIAKLDDNQGQMDPNSIGKASRSLRYVNGQPVLKDTSLTGADLMREILIELRRVDSIAYEELGYKQWSETNQKSTGNSPYIYKAVMDVLRRRGHKVGGYEGE